MDDIPMYYAKLRKPDSKGYIIQDYIYMTFFKDIMKGRETMSMTVRGWRFGRV